MLGFLLFGAVLPAALPRNARYAAVAVFTLLFGVRMATLGNVWLEHRQDVADMRTAIAPVEPGARVFVARSRPKRRRSTGKPVRRRMLSNGIRLDYHLPALLLIEHRAFWPFLFDNPSQQPVETLQPYRELADRARSIADRGDLAVPGKASLCGFDYLLLLEAGAESDLQHYGGDRLSLLTQSDMAALYRITPAACKMIVQSRQ